MMFSTILPLLVSALISCTLVTASNFKLANVTRSTSSHVVPGRYIVEFDTSAHLSSSGLKRGLLTPHDAVFAELTQRGVSFTVHQKYTSEVFIGASISVSSNNDLASLASTSGVINILPVHSLQLPAQPLELSDLKWTAKSGHGSKTTSKSSSTQTASVTTTTVCTTSGKKTSCTTSTITGTAPSATVTSSPTTGYSNLFQLQADKVQAAGNLGKGVNVAIIDSGVDYTRTPLGGCFGAGCKIAGGYDLVGDDYDGTNSPVPDSDPYDNCYTHGSITAGIIGANDNQYNVTGVAPAASIYVYRVFGCNGATTDDIVMQGMQMAYNQGVDVINLSLGETSGWTESALEVLASRMVANGTVVVASAGNEGQVGAFYAGSPASGLGVLNVGSFDNAIFPAQNATVSTGYGPITYYNYQSFPAGSYPLYAFTADPTLENDGCMPPDSTPDLSGYLVVVRETANCPAGEIAYYLYTYGATAVFFAAAESGEEPSYQNFPLINFGLISYEDGTYLLNQYAANASTTVSFGYSPVVVPNTWTGNTTSFFSEIGPTNDLHMAPTILAPGTNLIGVVPVSFSNWSITEGTSFSSAFVSGAAALYIASKGNTNVSPQTVREALEFSANQLPVSRSDNTLESVAAQGAGRVQIFDAINSGTIVTPTELLLNDTAYFQSLQYLTITNSGSSKINYKLSNVPAGTALAYQTGVNQSNDEPVPQVSNAASVTFSSSSFSLTPGKSNTITLKFSAPSGLDPQTFPIYSGWIQIAGASNTVQVPYMGVAAKMKDMPLIDSNNTPAILDSAGNVQSGTVSYGFNSTSGDYPTVMYRLVGGTPILLIDLVDSSASLGFTPTYNGRKRSFEAEEQQSARMKRAFLHSRKTKSTGPTATSPLASLVNLWCQLSNNKAKGCGGSGTSTTFSKVPILGNVYEADYIPRNTDNADGQGNDSGMFALSTATFTNGTTIPNGTYKFLLRALHITGDATNESDYEAWLSAPFKIAQ